ncbi:MAG TPA: protein kinase [Polyangiales bacterium]|nr:protein kinase [Polyangiales bacterium]
MSASVPAPAPDANEHAATDERYLPVRMLGQGGMGAVHLVRDRETGEQLALKKLLRMDARSVLRLKREFRSLADMSHPNLVKVYELGQARDAWFIAMEYVPGEDLQAYLGTGRTQACHSRLESALSQLSAYPRWVDEVLVPAFHQLASGVSALHRAGMLHRDLKPSNVLVANQRVVVLDFGLVRELDPNAPALTEEGLVSGTPAYMAPEQALGRPLTEASDWYAFGVMLYEALTGELPFDGSAMQLLSRKLDQDPVPPETLNQAVPPKLSALCTALLARDPKARPSGSAVLRALEPVRPQAATLSGPSPGETSLQSDSRAATQAAFFGRRDELAALWESLRETEEHQSRVVHVRGVSGAGKTSLVEHFVDQVETQRSGLDRPDALVLRSRCYEREAMPFKALDGVIDALSRYLTQLDDFECSHLLPANIAALTQLFPVLGRPRAVQHLLATRMLFADAVHNRQLAESALRELFNRLGTRRPVVIWIDDLQWGDLDSARILRAWLTQPLTVPLLLVLSYRADEVDTSECLQLLLSGEAAQPPRIVSVDALASDDVRALCRAQFPTTVQVPELLIKHIVREAQGSPFLAAQLSAVVQTRLTGANADLLSVSLFDLIEQSKLLLPPDALRLLSVLAVAGRPIAPKLALRAAGVRRGGREIVHALRGQLMVRTRDVAGERLLEVYHDRVRERVQQSLSASELVQLHASLLSALEFSGQTDPDWLHAHALGAQQRAAALRYGVAAAERAMSGLAFGHAAELYARCLDLNDGPAEQRRELLRKLAEALANSGHGPKAADAYLEASRLAIGPAAVELMRLATTHLLRSGRFEEGEAMLERVLQAMRLRMPKTRLGVLLALLWERLRIILRGRRFRPRTEDEIAPSQLGRLDALRALRVEMQGIDPLRGGLFLARIYRWSLDAGEPMRMLNAWSSLAYLVSLRGTRRAERRADELLSVAAALAEQLGTATARVQLLFAQAAVAWNLGRHRPALDYADAVERSIAGLAAERQEVNYYVRFSASSIRIAALYSLGEYHAFAAALGSALEEARATANVAAQLLLATNETFLDEINDRPEQSIVRLELQRTQLPRTGFGSFHTLHLLAVLHAGNTTGRYAWAMRLLEQDWPRHQRSPMRRTEILGMLAQAYRVRLLLNQYVAEGGGGSLAPIRAELAALQRDYQTPLVHGFACEIGARIAWLERNKERSIALLRQGIDATKSITDAARLHYVLGTLLGTDEGAALRAESEHKLREGGVKNPVRYVGRHFPELFPEH